MVLNYFVVFLSRPVAQHWRFADNDLDDVGDEPGQVAADEDPHDGDRDAGQSGRSYRSPGFESPTKKHFGYFMR